MMKKFSWTICLLVISFMLSMIFASCNSGGNQDFNVFHYNESAGISSLDPAFAKNQSNIWAVHQIFNTLVATDDQLNIIPSLAKSWQFSADNKQISFSLRQDVFFHDHPAFTKGKGRKMRALDVVYSFERLINPQTASPGAWIFSNIIDTLHPFEAVNDSLFVLRLRKPFVQILGVLSNQYCAIVPREAVEYKQLSFRSHPCGTGPFRFFKWVEGEVLMLKRNVKYFETDEKGQPLPYLDGVSITFLNNKATEFLEFRQGKFDFVNDIDPSFKDEILLKSGKLRKQWEGIIALHTGPYLNTEYLGFLMRHNSHVPGAVLQLREVRQAINCSIDKRKLMLYLRNSIGIPAEKGFIPPGLPGYDTAAAYGYVYDPAKAKRLLKEAGFNASNPFPEIILSTVPVYADLAAYIALELQNVGIPLKVEVVPKSLLLTQMANNRVVFFRGSWIADYPDAENFLSVFYSRNPSPPNYTRYNNPAFDEIYEASMQELDLDKRKKMYGQMDSLMMEDAPVIPLWYDQVIHLVQPNIEGFHLHPLNLLELKRVRKEVKGQKAKAKSF